MAANDGKYQDILKVVFGDMNQMELERFIRENGRDIYSFCCYLTKNRQEAEDLYQDAFVKVLEQCEAISDSEDIKNRILSAAVRSFRDKKRKFAWRRRITEEKYIPSALMDMEEGRENDAAEDHIVRQEKLALVRQCVDELPEKLRLAVLLYYMENKKIDEIAKILSIPPGTVKSRLYQAKKRLKKQLAEYQE